MKLYKTGSFELSARKSLLSSVIGCQCEKKTKTKRVSTFKHLKNELWISESTDLPVYHNCHNILLRLLVCHNLLLVLLDSERIKLHAFKSRNCVVHC